LEAGFAVHIAERIEVHHQRNCGDDDEHHYRNRVEQDAEVDVQMVGKPQPLEVYRHGRRPSVARFSDLEEILIGDCVCDSCAQRHSQRADDSGDFGFHFSAEKSQKEEHQ